MKHHHSAGGIVSASSNGEFKFLVIHQRRKNGELQWVMPKGHLEGGEAAENAARREIYEEVGLANLLLIGSAGRQTFTFKDEDGIENEKTVDWFVFRTDAPEQVTLNKDEGFFEAVWGTCLEVRERLSHPEFASFIERASTMLNTPSEVST